MSRFFSERYARLVPYTPGEQPQDMQYIKLNTNESPFPPSPGVAAAVMGECGRLQLYSDPESRVLTEKFAALYGVSPEQVIMTNGSDEVLNFAFMAFADEERPLAFPDITYGFYPVIAQLNRIPYTEIPLTEDFHINPADYIGCGKTVVIANPNAPTGIPLGLAAVEQITASNPDTVVIVDEAYVDFGGESCVPMIYRYDNLLVVQTMSKSRSLAGGRVGFALGSPELISALNRVKYSFNPYNVNRLSIVAGTAAVADEPYFQKCTDAIRSNRAWTVGELEQLGFTVLPSQANFIFAKSDRISGEDLYRKLKENGILVRWWSDNDRIRDYVRITIGSLDQMVALVDEVTRLLEEL